MKHVFTKIFHSDAFCRTTTPESVVVVSSSVCQQQRKENRERKKTKKSKNRAREKVLEQEKMMNSSSSLKMCSSKSKVVEWKTLMETKWLRFSSITCRSNRGRVTWRRRERRKIQTRWQMPCACLRNWNRPNARPNAVGEAVSSSDGTRNYWTSCRFNR